MPDSKFPITISRLLSELNDMKTEIEDLQVKLKVLRKYRKRKKNGDLE